MHPTANFDHYDVDSYALDGLDDAHRLRLQRILDFARANYESLAEAHEALTPQQRRRILTIAGVGQKTVFRLEFVDVAWGLWEKARKVTSRLEGNPHRDGDGRVPVASASLEKVHSRFVKGRHGGLMNIAAVREDILRFLAIRRSSFRRRQMPRLRGIWLSMWESSGDVASGWYGTPRVYGG